jgi:2,3-bisphosphoglycerate-dependent phosphoglycerate mutase
VPDQPTEYRQIKFQAPPGSTELLLVRHGESQPFREDDPPPQTEGHGDPPLAPEGHWQAGQLGARLAQEKIDAIYGSSLQRTQQTAAPLAARVGIEPTIEHDLREIHLGDWDNGLMRKMSVERHPLLLEAAAKEEWGLIPGAESDADLRARVMPVIERIVHDHADQRVVVVVHGGVIGAVLSEATNSRPWAFMSADNGSISHLVGHDGRWILRRFNDTGHLAGELSTETDPPA